MLKQTFLAVLVLLACWVALMEGLPTSVRGQCLCSGPGMRFVNRDRVTKIEHHKPTSRCGQEELVVTVENRKQCVNINEKQGRRIKKCFRDRQLGQITMSTKRIRDEFWRSCFTNA
ncbi:C-X-C motif chemokine 11 [Erythrolamprus reginae]|uniref:C-X-C motif chemokine 11 n=1 Tax=Erythrolamprus reginae TaxID=121349 RepID=UPI00396C6885